MAVPPKMNETDLFKFRTKMCERFVKHSKCDFADKCQYSHDLRWTRRPPWKYPYSPEMCPNVRHTKDERGRCVTRSTCWIQRKCKYAHTLEEQMYHPKIYKTLLCHQFQTDGWCERYYCPFAHSTSELRPIDSTFHPSMIINGNNQKESCPDAYLPSDRPHPKWRTQYLAQLESRRKKEWATCSDDGDERNKDLKYKLSSKTENNRIGETVNAKMKQKIPNSIHKIELPELFKIDGQEITDKKNENKQSISHRSLPNSHLSKTDTSLDFDEHNLSLSPDIFIFDGEEAMEIDRYRIKYLPYDNNNTSISGYIVNGIDLSSSSEIPVTVRYINLPSQIPTQYLKHYMDRWKHIDSDYVVAARDIYISELPGNTDMGLFIIMNKLQGTLTSMLNVSQIAKHVNAGVIPPEGLIEIIRGLLLGLNAIHRNELIHGRITPACIVLAEDYTMKITPGIGGALMSSLSMLCNTEQTYGYSIIEAIFKNLLSDLGDLNWIPAEIMIDFTHMADELQKGENTHSRFMNGLKYFDGINWKREVLESCDTWGMGLLIFYIVTGGHYPFGDIVNNPSIIQNMLEKNIVNLYMLNNSPFLYSLIELILRNYQNPNCLTMACCHPLFWTLEDSILFLNSTTNLALLKGVLENESSALKMFYNVLDKEVNWVDVSNENVYTKKFAAHANEYFIQSNTNPDDKHQPQTHTALQMIVLLKSYLDDKNIRASEKLDTLHAIFIVHTSSFVKVYEYFMLSGFHSNTYHIDNITDAIRAYEPYWKSLEIQANVTLNLLAGKMNNLSLNRQVRSMQDISSHPSLVKENNINDNNIDPDSHRTNRIVYRNDDGINKDPSLMIKFERSEVTSDSMWVT